MIDQPPVYVVDDNPDMRRSLEALLGACGYEVRGFETPISFLEELQTLRPGVVLLDLRMPEMNGIDVLEKMQDHLETFPVIFITAHGQIDLAVKAIKLGAKDFLQKPFCEKSLIAAIEQELDELKGIEKKDDQVPGRSLDALSPREREVVAALAEGLPNKVIASRLGLSVRTVEMHRARAMARLQCRTFADLLRIFLAAESDPPPRTASEVR